MQHRRYPIASLLSAALLLLVVRSADAQQARARTLTYDTDRKDWVEVPPPVPGTPEGDLHAIRALIKDAEYGKAFSAVRGFVRARGVSDRLYPEVLIAKAEALIGRRSYHEAYITLQEFLGEFAGMGLTSEALRLEIVIAETYLAGVKRKVWGLRWLSGEDTAFRILDEISADYPKSLLAEHAIKTKADYLFAKGEHALSELEYSRLLRDYPQSRHYQFCLRRSAEAALAGFEGVEYDEASLIEAEERYRDYRRFYPEAADREGVGLVLDGIREKRAEKDFSVGRYYERTDHLRSAIFQYQLVCERWPETIAATKATSRLELLGVLERTAAASGP